MAVPDLSEPERLLWDAYPRGAWADFRAGRPAADPPDVTGLRPERVIRAEIIRALLLGAGATEPGYAPGLRLRGARVSGALDLSGADLSGALVFEHCNFEDEIRFAESVTRTIRITESRFPGFDGTRMRVDGILDLSDCAAGQAVTLDQARVTGEVCLRGTTAGSAR